MPESNAPNRRRRDRVEAIERHIGTILGALILGSVLWVGNILTTNIDTAARTDVRLGNIESDLAEMKAEIGTRMSTFMTDNQAAALAKFNNRRFHALETWQVVTEGRLDSLELKVYSNTEQFDPSRDYTKPTKPVR